MAITRHINVLLLHYNNYFNRVVKKLDSVLDYMAADTVDTIARYADCQNINFNPADGVTTTAILGYGTNPSGTFAEDSTYDYAVVYEYVESGEDETHTITRNIISRWFIVEADRTRKGQFKIALKRDVLADFNSDLMEAPCFVEKGTISDSTSPLLFNSEGMQFNEIKQNELMLKDNTKCAWLVGYLKKGIDTATTISFTPKEAFASLTNISDKAWYECISYDGVPASKTYFYLNNETSKFCWKMQVPGNSWPTYADAAVKLSWNLNGQGRTYSYDAFNGSYEGMSQEAMIVHAPGWWSMGIDSPYCKKWSTEIIDKMLGVHDDLWQILKNAAITEVNTHGILTTTDIGDLLKYDKCYFQKDNKVYQLSVAPGSSRTETVQYTASSTEANALWNCVLPDVRETSNGRMTLAVATTNPTKPRAKFLFNGIEYSITATEQVLPGTISFTLGADGIRNNVNDAVYNMFAIPVDPTLLGITSENIPVNVAPPYMYITNNGDTIGTVQDFSKDELTFATELCKALGASSEASKIYDLQILPYAPAGIEAKHTGYYDHIDLTELTVDKDYQYIKNTQNDIKGIVFYPDRANFSKNIELEIPNETVHYEWQEIVNPVMLAQGTHDGLPMYRFAGFPYKVTDGTWDIGPNQNNPTAEDLILEDGLTLEECDYVSLSVSSGLNTPVVLLTSTEFPTPPAGQEYSYTFTGDFTIKVRAHWLIPDRPEDVKIRDACNFERIVSPNYNGMFQFKQSRLNGGLHYINVDCTYKPYTPYIKLNPDFSFLYGKDWNDSTGLICGGDFSLPMMNDAFTNYALQNKNYQEIFARQIENLDVNQGIAKEQQQFQGIMNIATATIGGAGAGAYAGFKAGGG